MCAQVAEAIPRKRKSQSKDTKVSETQHTQKQEQEEVRDKAEGSESKSGYTALLRSMAFILKGQEEPSKDF